MLLLLALVLALASISILQQYPSSVFVLTQSSRNNNVTHTMKSNVNNIFFKM